jgi:hypothetical protein
VRPSAYLLLDFALVIPLVVGHGGGGGYGTYTLRGFGHPPLRHSQGIAHVSTCHSFQGKQQTGRVHHPTTVNVCMMLAAAWQGFLLLHAGWQRLLPGIRQCLDDGHSHRFTEHDGCSSLAGVRAPTAGWQRLLPKISSTLTVVEGFVGDPWLSLYQPCDTHCSLSAIGLC